MAAVPLLDIDIFGKPATGSVTLLQGPEVIGTPVYVQTDVKNGRYWAANVSYPAPVTIDEVRAALNARFGESPATDKSSRRPRWRIDDKRIVIVLDEWEHGVVAYYLPYVTSDEALGAAFRSSAARSKDPAEEASGLVALSFLRFHDGQHAEVVRLLEEAIEVAPQQADSFFTRSILGRSYLALGRPQQGVESLQKARSMYLAEADYHSEFGREQYLATLTALVQALEATGQVSEATTVRNELSGLKQQSQ